MSWARRAGVASVAIGAVATGVALERLTVTRTVRRQARTALDVVAEFCPAFGAHDRTEALAAFVRHPGPRPAPVLAGDRDEITPPGHSERIAAALPHAELVRVPGAGHLVLLESPREVNAHLAELLTRSILEP